MIAVIINPIAGGVSPRAGQKRADIAASALANATEDTHTFVTEGRGHARELSAAAVRDGARLVIAWGGDGTVNEVATSLIGTPAALGIVPAGSGNGLARELGVDRRPERAIQDAVGGHPRQVDAGELGGRLFFSIAGVGFDAHVAACFDRDLAGSRGLTGYARITSRELLAYVSKPYRVTREGEAVDLRRALIVTLANSAQWGNGARIAPAAKVDDGLLDLVVLEERSRLSTICGLPRVFTGTINTFRGISSRTVTAVVIESAEPMPFHVDGEAVQGGTRLEGRVLPGALRVAVR